MIQRDHGVYKPTTTETPMRERIARAIATASSHELVEERWPTYLPDADAVLDAMREPTSGIMKALMDEWDSIGNRSMLDNWHSAIDAAKEGK